MHTEEPEKPMRVLFPDILFVSSCPILNRRVFEPCPSRMVVNLDSAYLRYACPTIRARPRCVRYYIFLEFITTILRLIDPV
jgi:hypothetical protein